MTIEESIEEHVYGEVLCDRILELTREAKRMQNNRIRYVKELHRPTLKMMQSDIQSES